MQWRLVEELNNSQVDDLVELHHHTYWAAHRRREDVMAMLKGIQYVFGVVEEDAGRLRAFTLVLIDKVFQAVVFDVVVHPQFRAQGLVRMIFDEMTAHPDLRGIEQLVLYCTEDVSRSL